MTYREAYDKGFDFAVEQIFTFILGMKQANSNPENQTQFPCISTEWFDGRDSAFRTILGYLETL